MLALVYKSNQGLNKPNKVSSLYNFIVVTRNHNIYKKYSYLSMIFSLQLTLQSKVLYNVLGNVCGSTTSNFNLSCLIKFVACVTLLEIGNS